MLGQLGGLLGAGAEGEDLETGRHSTGGVP
jgi:hypothetical protein